MRTFGNKKKRTNVKAYVKLSSYYTVVILFFKMKVSLSILKTSKEETVTKKKKEKLKIIRKWKLLINEGIFVMSIKNYYARIYFLDIQFQINADS